VYLSGGAPQFTDFLEKELIPFVDSVYRTKPQDRTLIGMSYGGVYGTYVLLKRPGIFKRYILGTTYFGYENDQLYTYEKEYAASHADLPARVYASVGGAETYALKHFEDFTRVLADRKYPSLKLKAEVLPDEVHSSVGGGTLARGLRWVFDGYFYDDRRIVPLAPERYDEYAGLYEHSDHKFKVTLVRKDNALVLRTEDGKEEIEFFPESESDFFAKKEKFQLAFYQEKKKVAGFVLQGKEGRFKRIPPGAGKK
jgi:pimeloyl-ACP methyl ester carboxylesterase